MTDTDIRAALERTTRELRTPPDLLDRVRAGGRRRVVRRRAVLAAGLAAVTAGSTAGVLLHRDGRGGPVASPLFDRATRGDLRSDREFLDRLRATWLAKAGNIPVTGQPHVVWAGLAPHGARVAVVGQRVPEALVSPAGRVRYGMLGFAEQEAGGTLRMISLEELLTGVPHATAVLLGRDRKVLMVLDDGRGVQWSPEVTYTAGGTIGRTFTPLDFRAQDGVAFAAVPDSRTLIRAGLRAGVPDDRGDRTVGLANLPRLVAEAGRGDPETGARRFTRSLTGTDPAPTGGGPWDLTGRADLTDRYGYRVVPPADTWLIRGVTPDRRPFAVQTLAGTDDRLRLFLSLGTPDPVLQGLPDPAADLSLQLRLPGEQGVVVAAAGATLRFRVPRGPWLPVTGDAALLPAAAAEAEVTRPGRRAVRVRLT